MGTPEIHGMDLAFFEGLQAHTWRVPSGEDGPSVLGGSGELREGEEFDPPTRSEGRISSRTHGRGDVSFRLPRCVTGSAVADLPWGRAALTVDGDWDND